MTPQEALSGFSTPIVIMMAGLFIVGGAIFNTGLAKMIGARLLRLGGGSPVRLFFVVVVATGLIGGFVSNTGTVAIMLPIIVSMAAAANISPARYLMPVAFASSIGGMLTLIGTPPNALVMSAGGYSLMDYVKVGGPLQLILGLIMILIIPLIFPF